MASQADVHEEERSEPVSIDGLVRIYPAPVEFDDLDPEDRSFNTISLLAKAPWFHRQAVLHGGVCERYADERGMLPGDIPLSALGTWSWINHFCCEDGDLRKKGDKSTFRLRMEFVRSALAGLDRIGTFRIVPPEMNVDLFLYRTYGEVGYVERLHAIPDDLLTQWRDVLMVDDRAYLLGKPALRIEFRFLRKDSEYWTNYVRNERRAAEATGFAVPHQCVTQNEIRKSVKTTAYVRLNNNFSKIDPPRGCDAEWPTIFSYKASVLIADPRSGYWVVAYTEKVARTCAFIMHDAYDSYRLWNVSRRFIELARQLNLVPVLGNDANVTEFRMMLGLIERTNFRTLPGTWRSRAKSRHHTVMVGATYMYYDPYKQVTLTEVEYERLRDRPRPIRPANYPTGYDFTQEIPGWDEVTEYAVGAQEDYDEDEDGDSRMGNDDGEDVDYWEAGMEDEPQVGGGNSGNDATRIEHIRTFLREVGVPADVLRGSIEEMRGYLRGRLDSGTR